jgi:hypothetical protein
MIVRIGAQEPPYTHGHPVATLMLGGAPSALRTLSPTEANEQNREA